MIAAITVLFILFSACTFGIGIKLDYILSCSSAIITALSVITAAVFVRLNRGMPTLDWKGAPASARDRLTSAILKVTGEYIAIVAINGTFLIFALFLVAIGKNGSSLFTSLGQQIISAIFGGLAATSLARTGYVVWRDYDIVFLQKNLIDAAALSEQNTKESSEAALRLAVMSRVTPQAPIRPQEWSN